MQQLTKIYKSSIADLDEKGIVTVAANAFGNEDSDGDISEQGSFTKTIKENFARVKWFLNHDRTMLLGVPLEAIQTARYLQTRGQLNMQKQMSRDVYEDYRLYAEHGKTLEHSIGVSAIKRDKADSRRVLEWKWWEYSTLTSWGANEDTPMLGMKGMKAPLAAIAWLETCLKQGNYTDTRGRQMEAHISKIKALLTCNEPPAGTRAEQEPPFDIQKGDLNN